MVEKVQSAQLDAKDQMLLTPVGKITSSLSMKRISHAKDVTKVPFDMRRVKTLISTKEAKTTGVLYWMSRDQRVEDNWALLYAQKIALEEKKPFIVCFNVAETYLDSTWRQYKFMLEGLTQVSKKLYQFNIPFKLLQGECSENIPKFMSEANLNCLVTDFTPLNISKTRVAAVQSALMNNKAKLFCEVDAHDIIPVWECSNKKETGARTLRPKYINRLPEFLTEFPAVAVHSINSEESQLKHHSEIDINDIKKFLKCDKSVPPVEWIKPGTDNALLTLSNFLDKKLGKFFEQRNDPTKESTSNLSPYLHYGQLSAQRMALMALDGKNSKSIISNHMKLWKESSLNAFLEESLIRRELANNYCFYQPNYDNLKGAEAWAVETLNVHRNDKREHVYTYEQFEQSKTHDPAWNAAQTQMVKTGKMHGFFRMYWAKKILEWAESPEEALRIAIKLNDKFEIDGCDPNGYTGVMWSIAGVHDQGFAERPVTGKIRPMTYSGCKRKFDLKAFEMKYLKAPKIEDYASK